MGSYRLKHSALRGINVRYGPEFLDVFRAMKIVDAEEDKKL